MKEAGGDSLTIFEEYKNWIGNTSDEVIFEVEKGAIRAFARAIGAGDFPLYTDEAFARRQGYASLVAPPTFPTTFFIPMPGVNVPLSRLIHGEQAFIYERPIVAGDVLRVQRKIVDVVEKKGGRWDMLIAKTEYYGRDLQGNLVYTAKTNVIIH
jgi:acyl dehydratase